MEETTGNVQPAILSRCLRLQPVLFVGLQVLLYGLQLSRRQLRVFV